MNEKDIEFLERMNNKRRCWQLQVRNDGTEFSIWRTDGGDQVLINNLRDVDEIEAFIAGGVEYLEGIIHKPDNLVYVDPDGVDSTEYEVYEDQNANPVWTFPTGRLCELYIRGANLSAIHNG